MNVQLAGKCAVVTGGSRGIGRAISLALAKHGATVAACYNQDSEAVTTLASELDGLGAGSFVVQADVSDEGSVAGLARNVRTRMAQVDVLINNAGVVSHRTITDLDLAEWRRVLDTNLTSMFLVTRALVDAIPSGGSVINITSAVAMRGMAGRTHYTA